MLVIATENPVYVAGDSEIGRDDAMHSGSPLQPVATLSAAAAMACASALVHGACDPIVVLPARQLVQPAAGPGTSMTISQATGIVRVWGLREDGSYCVSDGAAAAAGRCKTPTVYNQRGWAASSPWSTSDANALPTTTAPALWFQNTVDLCGLTLLGPLSTNTVVDTGECQHAPPIAHKAGCPHASSVSCSSGQRGSTADHK